MADRKLVMKHNPGFLGADDLVESFLARRAELDSLLETLHNNTTSSNQHVLVIGRRGMGKTMLVRRLALAIERDTELASRWYPILFGEEAYGVSTAGELWLEALHQLGVQTGDARWRNAHEVLRQERDERRLRDLALARLLDFADERGVRLMIVVENLQDILGQQMPEDEGWTLRHTLLNEPRVMLLATATNRFDDIDTPKAASYELFGVLNLRPLDSEECRALWERLTGERLEGHAIRPVEIVTGGNPRLLTILASFARGRTLHEFMTDLLGLVDELSDYFKSNIEALSLDERRAFVALCDLWEPSTARAVAEIARFDINKTSMLLGRLVNRGAVEIARVRGRVQYYQVCERLYNLFHRLRRSSSRDNRAVSVVEFMTRFYAPDRLPELAVRIAAEVCRQDSRTREDTLLVLDRLAEKVPIPSDTLFLKYPTEFWQLREAGRQDLSWNPHWWARRVRFGIRTAPDGSLLESEFDDADAPVVQLCNRVLVNDVSLDELLRRLSEYVKSASRFAVMLTIAAAVAKGIAPEGMLTSVEGFRRCLLGVMASSLWSNPELRAFAIRQLYHATGDPNQVIAEAAGTLLVDRCIEAGDFHPFDVSWAHASCEMLCKLGNKLEPHDPARAESMYRSALERCPDDLRAMTSLARLFVAQNRFAEADFLSHQSWLRHPGHIQVADTMIRVLGTRRRGANLRAFLIDFFAEPSKVDFSTGLIEDWVLPLSLAADVLDRDTAVAMLREFELRFAELTSYSGLTAFIIVMSSSKHLEVAQIAWEWAARITGEPGIYHVAFAERFDNPDRALDILQDVARSSPETLHHLLGIHRHTLMRLALANPERLHRIATTIPLFEPLAIALAAELGLDVDAPHEVMEIAKDIRAELRQLRGPTYEVEVPILAAAEDSPRPRRSKKPPTRRKPAAPKKPTSRKR
jgi:hypothetical protein